MTRPEYIVANAMCVEVSLLAGAMQRVFLSTV